MYGKPKTPQETVKTGEQTEQVEDKTHTQNQLCFTMFCEFLLVEQSQSVTLIHTFLLLRISFPFKSPQNTEQSSLAIQ